MEYPEQPEEQRHKAAQRRLETVYGSSAGELESLYLQVEGEAGRVQDLVQLLKAIQVDGGASVETRAEVAIASDVLEALTSTPRLAAAARAGASTESAPATGPLPDASSPLCFPIAVGPAGSAAETDRRSEPRESAVQMVKVAALRDLEREMSCALVNTSDSGIRFTSDADIAIGEILVAELPGQLVLAEVRHSQAKDGRFAIGAERVQSMSKDGAPLTNCGTERAELLIKALCDRVGTGFADEPGQEPGTQREQGLARVARILEIWQRAKPADSVVVPAERAPSIGAGRTFATVGLSLVIVALLMMCVVQYRKYEAPIPPPAPVRVMPAPPPIALKAPAVPTVHRARIKALQSTWVSISTDGHRIFGATIPKGSTQDLEYSRIAFLHAGNAAGIEVTVDGQTVPMGNKPSLRLVELNTTGYRLLRWINDDPPDITPASKHD
jgi:hypothetical protein